MKAAVCRAFGQDLSIEDIHLAEPDRGELRVKLKASAICHSDIFFLDGSWGGDLPAVYGHEAAGIVEAVGADVRSVSPGDHVVVTLIRYCGECHYCQREQNTLCEASFHLDENSPLHDSLGEELTHGLRTGAFAEKVVVEASQVCAIDKDIPFDVASLLACGVLTGFGAVTNTVTVPPGSSVAVIGCGGVGLNSIQGAVHVKAGPIIAIDVVAEKLSAARLFGASHTINGREDNTLEQIHRFTEGRGVDYVFVTVGAKSAIDEALTYLAKGGSAVIVGMPASGVSSEYDPGTLASLGQRLIGSKMGSANVQHDIPMLAAMYKEGTLKLDELISGRYPIENINEAIALVKQGRALRNVIVFP
ncbi:MAG: S-(hydroxymethyl)glutathione dehydrogenase/alcohol dehydrogenase [Halieaceae bacterium]|jgi:S-(hydroxymethyl)glutathione dehydrogenase/alcohol dehydrogenase